MKRTIFLLMATLLTVACSEKKMETISIDNMDLTVNPADDFYKYANGSWMARTKIPEDKSRYAVFDILNDLNNTRLKELVDEISSKKQAPGSNAEKIARFYNSGMDTAAINKAGIEPVRFLFDSVSAISNLTDLQDIFALFNTYTITTPFLASCGFDGKNSTMYALNIEQDGLGMSDRDYYLKSEEYFSNIRNEYKNHLAKMFKLLGQDDATASASAKCVFDIEYQLAEISMDKERIRDPFLTYNKMDIEKLSALTSNIDWKRYFKKIGCQEPEYVIVFQTDYMSKLNGILKQTSIADWKTYLTWCVINNTASCLSSDFDNQNFDFYGRVFSGSQQQKPRWERILASTSKHLDDAVGQLYVEKYFPPQAKHRALELVNNLRQALKERIDQLEWMSDDTKVKAQEKLAAINVKIGYPDEWFDFSGYQTCDTYVTNVLNMVKYRYERDIKDVGKHVDKGRWYMSAQTVNAYYMPPMNEIVFPAAILQPPFFYANGDDAINYGAIGVVIGHEITHGFDDEGRNYDKDGNICEWWTEEDSRRFTERAQTLVNRFNSFIAIDTMHANGSFTLGENIADLGGLNIAYTAFSKTEQWKDQSVKLDGFTPDQRFFIAYAQVWCQVIRDEEIRRRTQTDPHALGCYRIEGPLPSVEAFVKAFDVKPGDRYYLPDSLKTVIW